MWSNESQYAELERSLTNVTPNAGQVDRIERMRGAAKSLGQMIIATAPSSPNRTHAIRQLEDAVMWAVKAIVLEETE